MSELQIVSVFGLIGVVFHCAHESLGFAMKRRWLWTAVWGCAGVAWIRVAYQLAHAAVTP